MDPSLLFLFTCLLITARTFAWACNLSVEPFAILMDFSILAFSIASWSEADLLRRRYAKHCKMLDEIYKMGLIWVETPTWYPIDPDSYWEVTKPD